MNTVSGCLYISIGAQSLAWTHALPFIVTLSLTAASIGKDASGGWGKEILLVLYGFYLHFWQYGLYAVQESFAYLRPDPYCSQIHTYAFPSQEAFYVASLATFIVFYAFLWNIHIPPLYWFCLWVFVIGPPAVLVWFLYNRWWEVLVSMILGWMVTMGYVLIFRIYMLDHIPYMLHQAPWTWFSCVDSWSLDSSHQAWKVGLAARIARAEKIIDARVKRSVHNFGWRLGRF